jgi:hypothetical protein
MRRAPLLCLPTLLLAALLSAQDDAPADPHAAWRARLLDDGRAPALEDVSGNACLACHATIGEEWRHSTHAAAWQDELYNKELRKIRRKQGCYGCHAPVDLAGQELEKTPEARAEQRHLGVTCTTCHLDTDGETMLGPAGHANAAHPSRKSERFDFEAQNALCITCHNVSIGPVIGIAKDFVEGELADLGDTCVGCHMPSVVRAWANDPQGERVHPERSGRSHRLETPRDPRFLRTAFELTAARAAGGAVLTLQNLTGHRVPGLIGRELRFELRLVAADGEERGAARHTFDHRSYLPVEDSFELTVEGTRAATLEVTAWHAAPGAREEQRFLERSFVLP